MFTEMMQQLRLQNTPQEAFGEFAKLMNKKAEELELKDTHFITPHGLDEDEHYTTAYELAKISDYALKIEQINKIVKTKTYTVNPPAAGVTNAHIKIVKTDDNGESVVLDEQRTLPFSVPISGSGDGQIVCYIDGVQMWSDGF